MAADKATNPNAKVGASIACIQLDGLKSDGSKYAVDDATLTSSSSPSSLPLNGRGSRLSPSSLTCRVLLRDWLRAWSKGRVGDSGLVLLRLRRR